MTIEQELAALKLKVAAQESLTKQALDLAANHSARHGDRGLDAILGDGVVGHGHTVVGGGTGTMTTVKEGGVQVGGADIVTLDFGTAFDVVETPDTEVNITLDLNELTTETSIDAGVDFIIMVDATDLGSGKILAEDIPVGYDTETAIVSGDFVIMVDITDNNAGKITFANFESTIDHGNVTGLGDDDHTQYALLLGRAGGQILRGGTAASDDLDLRSTSNATKGDIFLGGGVTVPGNEAALALAGTDWTPASSDLGIGELSSSILIQSIENIVFTSDADNSSAGSSVFSWYTDALAATGTQLMVMNSTGQLSLTATSGGLFISGTSGTLSVSGTSGTIDFGSAASFELPNSATPTVNADGELALDTTVTDFSHGVLKYFGGEEMGIVAMPIAEFTTPTNAHVVTYNATNDEFELAAGGGGGTPTLIEDADQNTKVQTEESADENIIRMDVAGTQRFLLIDNPAAATDEHLTITGRVVIADYCALGNNSPSVLDTRGLTVKNEFNFSSGFPVPSGIQAEITDVSSGTFSSAIGLGGFINSSASATTVAASGLSFEARHSGANNKAELVAASIDAATLGGSSGVITDMIGLRINATSAVNGLTPDYRSIAIKDPTGHCNAAADTCLGIQIDKFDEVTTSNNRRPIWYGNQSDGLWYLGEEGQQFMKEQTAPGTPPTNYIVMYGKDSGGVPRLFYKDEAGTEYGPL